MTKNIFKLALLSLLLNSSGVLAADNSAVLGQWDLSLNLQGNEVLVKLTITEDGDGLGGTWAGPQATNALSDVSWRHPIIFYANTAGITKGIIRAGRRYA